MQKKLVINPESDKILSMKDEEIKIWIVIETDSTYGNAPLIAFHSKRDAENYIKDKPRLFVDSLPIILK